MLFTFTGRTFYFYPPFRFYLFYLRRDCYCCCCCQLFYFNPIRCLVHQEIREGAQTAIFYINMHVQCMVSKKQGGSRHLRSPPPPLDLLLIMFLTQYNKKSISYPTLSEMSRPHLRGGISVILGLTCDATTSRTSNRSLCKIN